MSSLPYHEPDRLTIITISSFLILLNAIDSVLNNALYCGLLGQVLLGVAYGLPGLNILSIHFQEITVQLGYLGLILLVYEGGLSVPLSAVKANIYLSACVAITGIAAPIGLSFILMPLLNATTLQAFAAGAALCSTSLGTTFTVLKTSGLAASKLGSVLSTAAMMDDVIGLVMVQVIANLGASGGSIEPVAVVRPILVSLGFAIVVPLACKFAIRPVRSATRERALAGKIHSVLQNIRMRFLLHTSLLFGLVAAAVWSGTSVLFTAYLAGAIINWWDEDTTGEQNEDHSESGTELRTTKSRQIKTDTIPQHCNKQNEASSSNNNESIEVVDQQTSDHAKHKTKIESPIAPETESESIKEQINNLSGQAVYKQYYQQPVDRIFKPFFFASIGFSIPITSLFKGSLVWRGVVYTILMILAKLVCGFWLLRMPVVPSISWKGTTYRFARFRELVRIHILRRKATKTKLETTDQATRTEPQIVSTNAPDADANDTQQTRPQRPVTKEKAPLSLYPATMLGSAMVARGEIGFLISSIAESNNIWRTEPDVTQSSDIFIVVIWAIFLCTFIGPVAVGLIVRRVKRLESASPRKDVLGSWGLT